jgi:prevent-host-death family protein
LNGSNISSLENDDNSGGLIDVARPEPVTIERHGRAVAVVLAVKEYERLRAIEAGNNG